MKIADDCPEAKFLFNASRNKFIAGIRARKAEALAAWRTKAEARGLAEMRGFVTGLRRELAAVKAALTYAWSNGQVEGQVNRLKLRKRMMYGRANFDLLRQRVLHPV